MRYFCHLCFPCYCPRPCRCFPLLHPYHEANALDVIHVLVKTPGLYLVPEMRYSCHGCCPMSLSTPKAEIVSY